MEVASAPGLAKDQPTGTLGQGWPDEQFRCGDPWSHVQKGVFPVYPAAKELNPEVQVQLNLEALAQVQQCRARESLHQARGRRWQRR